MEGWQRLRIVLNIDCLSELKTSRVQTNRIINPGHCSFAFVFVCYTQYWYFLSITRTVWLISYYQYHKKTSSDKSWKLFILSSIWYFSFKQVASLSVLFWFQSLFSGKIYNFMQFWLTILTDSCYWQFIQIVLAKIFTDSALWAGSVIEFRCLFVCLCVCVFVWCPFPMRFFSRPLISPQITGSVTGLSLVNPPSPPPSLPHPPQLLKFLILKYFENSLVNN